MSRLIVGRVTVHVRGLVFHNQSIASRGYWPGIMSESVVV